MSDYNYIEVTVIALNNYDPPRYEYRWIGNGNECNIDAPLFYRIVGDERDPVLGEVIHVGQYELTCVWQSSMFEYTFTRNKRFARLKTVRFQVVQWLQLINYRILRTLIVWNLARTDPGTIPGWQDVHLVRRIKGMYWKSINFMRRIRERLNHDKHSIS